MPVWIEKSTDSVYLFTTRKRVMSQCSYRFCSLFVDIYANMHIINMIIYNEIKLF
ncbi:hypothetical protein NP493_964g00042 [Ridgeia piscesae]|uniref:Uncharacterized protein n=1 Tax=Ridgeia piscesae TaxID=27915 RepID=A0AAD9KKM3_RIDPI|nr:hypothetical protein NP493_964g00042 [Ridgeia piscesae]